jgi:hypothetical protein
VACHSFGGRRLASGPEKRQQAAALQSFGVRKLACALAKFGAKASIPKSVESVESVDKKRRNAESRIFCLT